MKTKFSQNANFKDLLKRNQNAIVDAALNGLEATDNFKLMQSLIKAKLCAINTQTIALSILSYQKKTY